MNFKKKVSGSWVDAPYYLKSTDTETITTLPATIYPLAQTATIGLEGNTTQNGTPTPDSPIMPQGTGERTGNLFDIENITHEFLNSDGTISFESGMNLSELIRVDGDYTVSWNAVRSGAYMRVSTYDDNKNFIARIDTKDTYARSSYSNTHIGYIRLNYENSYQLSDVQVNTGSTPLPYEPYGYKIPISSAGQTTPVYLGEVQTTRQIKKLVFDGTESFTLGTNNQFLYINNTIKPTMIPIISSHYKPYDNDTSDKTVRQLMSGFVSATVISIRDTSYANTADFKAYLTQQYAAGTPVCVWYVLATEETAVINEPLMRIGDYADTVSNVSIPVVAGGDTISVGTTVQPSEVTVNYKGWHPVADVHERDNGAWT